mgnify:CR=1 FL=1
MKLKFIKFLPKNTGTDLTLISEDPTIYTPKVYDNPLSFLKKGSVIWVKKETYSVYELTEDITDANKNDFIESIKSSEHQ